MQAAGIVIEDVVQAVYRRAFKAGAGPNQRMFERGIGYAWVLFFLVWTSPVWIFPVTVKMREEDALISFDAVKSLFTGR